MARDIGRLHPAEIGLISLVGGRGMSIKFREKLPDLARCYFAEISVFDTSISLGIYQPRVEGIFSRFNQIIKDQNWDLETLRSEEAERFSKYRRIYLSNVNLKKTKVGKGEER